MGFSFGDILGFGSKIAGLVTGNPWIAGIGSAIGSGVSYFAQNQASDTNAQDAFRRQEYLQNTAHQREVADLSKAGLNPILSANAGAGGGGPPAASLPQSPDLSSVISSALQLKQMSAQIDLLREQARKTNIEGTLASKNAPLADAQNKLLSKLIPGLESSASSVIDAAEHPVDTLRSMVSSISSSAQDFGSRFSQGQSQDSSLSPSPDLFSPNSSDSSSLY